MNSRSPPHYPGNEMNLVSSCFICSADKIWLPSQTKKYVEIDLARKAFSTTTKKAVADVEMFFESTIETVIN